MKEDKIYLADTTDKSPAFFDTVLRLTDYMEDRVNRHAKEEKVDYDSEQKQWLNYIKENKDLSDLEKEKLEKYTNNMYENLKTGKTMKGEKTMKDEMPTVDEVIDVVMAKPKLTMKHTFSPHDLRDVSWADVHNMTQQHQFRIDEIVKAQRPVTSFNGVIEKLYEPELLFEEPGVARVERKPSGYEVVEARTGGKRDVYSTPEQAMRAVSALKKEARLSTKEEELVTYEELSKVEDRLMKEEDSILGRDLREKIKEAKRRLLQRKEEEETTKANFPSVGDGTRTKVAMKIGDAGPDGKANPIRLG